MLGILSSTYKRAPQSTDLRPCRLEEEREARGEERDVKGRDNCRNVSDDRQNKTHDCLGRIYIIFRGL